MKLRQWFRRLCYFFKIKSRGLPQYLNDLIPKPSVRYTTRFSPIPNFKVRTEFFRNSFFPYTVNEWNNLDNIIKSSDSFLMFRKRTLNLIRPKRNETYGIHNPTGLTLLIRLRLGLSHLNDHKSNHSLGTVLTHFVRAVWVSRIMFTFSTLPSFFIAKTNPHEQY